MPARFLRVLATVALALLLLALALTLPGCTAQSADSGSADKPSEQPAPEPEPEPEEPTYSSYAVTIVDDDSYTKDGITYSIALNLQATNPSADIAGEYKGEATAKTDSSGTYQGKQLSASAIAKSSQLSFTLESGGGDLAGLTTDTVTYGGSGSITMKASGSGTYGQAGGSFGNVSGQSFTMMVTDENITMQIPIEGHTYKFTGTITGRE